MAHQVFTIVLVVVALRTYPLRTASVNVNLQPWPAVLARFGVAGKVIIPRLVPDVGVDVGPTL